MNNPPPIPSLNVLIACEESQTSCLAFRQLGHNAYSCDLQPCSGGHPEWHIQGDVSKVLNPKEIYYADYKKAEHRIHGIEFQTMDGKSHVFAGRWDLIIAHPPCTYFSRAGANWLYRGGVLNKDRYEKGLAMKALFMSIYNADCPKIAIENPVTLKIFELPPFTQEIQPYQFGHPYTKLTRLWLKGLPELKPTKIVEPVAKWVSCGYGGNRELQNKAVCKQYDSKRAKTFDGVAEAMAEQWG